MQIYDEYHAKILNYLKGIGKGKISSKKFLDVCFETKENDEFGIVLIREDRIIYIVNSEIKWEIKTKVIALAELEESGIVLHLSDGSKIGEVTLPIKIKEEAASIYEKINKIIVDDK